MMRKSSLNKRSRRFNDLLLVVSCSMIFLLVVAVTGLSAKRHELQAAMDTASVTEQSGRDEIKIELRNEGFSPAQIQHSNGTFPLLVENKALSSGYTLQLKAADGTLLHELSVQKGSVAWTVSLQTGQYTLTVVDHPQWVCQLTVQ